MPDLMTLDEAPVQKPITPVTLPTRRDYAITTAALEFRAERLKKLAQTALAEGYPREARVMDADVSAIKSHILPAFAEQRELPLATPAAVRAGIANALRPIVHRALTGLIVKSVAQGGKPRLALDDERETDPSEGGLRFRENEALDRIAERVEHYAQALAQDAYNAGYAARADEPTTLCQRALVELSDAVANA